MDNSSFYKLNEVEKDLSKSIDLTYLLKYCQRYFGLRYFGAPTPTITFRYSHEYWIPLFILYTGATLQELVQLDIKDVIEIDDRFVLFIHDNNTDSKIRSLSSVRVLPIHSQLIKLGFPEYFKATQRNGSTYLFDVGKVQHFIETLSIDYIHDLSAFRRICYQTLKKSGHTKNKIAIPFGFKEPKPAGHVNNPLEGFFVGGRILDSLKYDFIDGAINYCEYLFTNTEIGHTDSNSNNNILHE